MAITVSGRVSVNLNYTLTDTDIRYCIAESGIRHVITSRKFLEKKPVVFDPATQLIFLEDVKEKLTGDDKVLMRSPLICCRSGFSNAAWA